MIELDTTKFGVYAQVVSDAIENLKYRDVWILSSHTANLPTTSEGMLMFVEPMITAANEHHHNVILFKQISLIT